MLEWIAELTATYERLTAGWPEWAVTAGGLSLLCVAAWIGDTVVRRQLVRSLRLAVGRTPGRWDDALIDHGVISRLSHVIPAIVVYFGVGLIPGIGEAWRDGIRNVALAYAAFIAVRAVAAALTTINTMYERRPEARRRPIKGYVQLATLFAYCCGAILIVSALLGESPFVLLTGFGALTAVLLLVFRDTILSLVASVQLSSLDMVRVGDWIEMPQLNADGDVIDIALHTVRIQNWDKTITTIPTHRLISESFQNWRGMSESGGRRIKRSLVIDIASIRFLEKEEIEHFRRMVLLADYLADKEQELADYNAAIDADLDEAVNLRRLTNIGTFRAYALNYLRQHPHIHKSMTLLVRQLQPTAEGLPIEIYCFTSTTAWGDYEAIQSDIFDHLLAVLNRFGLKAYQLPSNEVVEALVPAASRESRGLS
ncbi:MAG: mechanosensitive ion channel domain-containing protein [Pseudomonadota bacterium]